MTGIKNILDKLIMAVLVAQAFSLVLIISVAVFFRYVLGTALSWPEEVAGIIFVWYTLLGIVVLVGSESHIAFDFFEKNTHPAVGYIIRLISQLAVIVYGGVMAVYGWQYFNLFPGELSAAAGINLGWLKISVPVAGILLVVYIIFNIFAGGKSDNDGGTV